MNLYFKGLCVKVVRLIIRNIFHELRLSGVEIEWSPPRSDQQRFGFAAICILCFPGSCSSGLQTAGAAVYADFGGFNSAA